MWLMWKNARVRAMICFCPESALHVAAGCSVFRLNIAPLVLHCRGLHIDFDWLNLSPAQVLWGAGATNSTVLSARKRLTLSLWYHTTPWQMFSICLWDATGHPARIQIFHANSGAEVNVSGLAESVRDSFKRSCRSSSNSLAGKRVSRCLMVCKSWLPVECFTGRRLWTSLVEMVLGKDLEKEKWGKSVTSSASEPRGMLRVISSLTL